MRHLVFLAALVAGAGCGGGSNGSDGADLAMAEPRDMAKIRPDLWQPSGCIKGVLQDEAGKPIAMESVLACSAVVCLYGMSGADGSFQICGLHIEPLAIKTEEHCKAPRKGAAMAQALLARDGDTVDVGLLIVPDLGAGVQLAPKMAMPQTLMVGDGLTLTIVSNDFEYPLGGNDCTLAGHLVPPAKHFNFKIPRRRHPAGRLRALALHRHQQVEDRRQGGRDGPVHVPRSTSGPSPSSTASSTPSPPSATPTPTARPSRPIRARASPSSPGCSSAPSPSAPHPPLLSLSLSLS